MTAEVVIGVDPSTRCTALAVVCGTTGRLLADDVRRVRGKTPTPARVDEMVQACADAFAAYGPGGGVVALEDLAVTRNAQTTKLLAKLQGRIHQEAIRHGYEVVLVQPRTWQHAMLRIGFGAKREQVKLASLMVASALVGFAVTDQDLADAICIAAYVQGGQRARKVVA